MKLIKNDFLVIAVILGGLLFTWNYYEFSYVPFLANSEVNLLIQKHHVGDIDRVAANKKTKSFLLQLKKSTRCDEVSDFQGGSDTLGAYFADINGHEIRIDMRKKSLIYWQIEKITYYPHENN